MRNPFPVRLRCSATVCTYQICTYIHRYPPSFTFSCLAFTCYIDKVVLCCTLLFKMILSPVHLTLDFRPLFSCAAVYLSCVMIGLLSHEALSIRILGTSDAD